MTEPIAERVQRLLDPAFEVGEGADGGLLVRYHDVPTSIHVFALGDDLDVLALTTVVAWNLPLSEKLMLDVNTMGLSLRFGGLRVATRDVDADVVLAFNLPVGGLSDDALLSVLLMVLADGVDARRALVS